MYVHECETVVPDLGKILESHNIAKLPPCGEEQPDGIAQISNRRLAENLIIKIAEATDRTQILSRWGEYVEQNRHSPFFCSHCWHFASTIVFIVCDIA